MLFRAYSRPQTESTVRPFPKGVAQGGAARTARKQAGRARGSLGCPWKALARKNRFRPVGWLLHIILRNGRRTTILARTKRPGIPLLPLRIPPARRLVPCQLRQMDEPLTVFQPEPWNRFTAGLVAAMAFARLPDFLSTWVVTPKLELEANPLMI